MGFFDAILGRSKLPKAKTESQFAISTASITLKAQFNIYPTLESGLCLKPIESSKYEVARKEIEDLLYYSTKETHTEYTFQKDEYNFLWTILKDPDFDDIVNNIYLISQTMIENGFGEQLLCAVYKFNNKKTDVYWIYHFKQDAYYPFVPVGKNNRDSSMEFRLKSIIEKEIPIEKDIERWYPLWGIPF